MTPSSNPGPRLSPDRSQPVQWVILFLVCLPLLASVMLPLGWSGNEINYFDLAYAHVRPDLRSPDFAARDSSQGRVLSFTLIGRLIDALGFDAARLVLAFALIVLLAAGYAWLALTLGLSIAEGALALGIYVLGPQSLLGGEWLFGGVEAKVLAYAAVLPGLALAWRGQALQAALCLAFATWFHFLVGAFWALALLLLLALGPHGLAKVWRAFLLWTFAILPLVWLLLRERVGGPPVDMTGLDLSLGEIYATFRNPHHVAPFISLSVFGHGWLSGILMSVVLAGLFGLSGWRAMVGSERRLAVWLCLMNLYLLVAMLLAFLDREAHRLAPLYLFRPAGLIFLISLMGGIHLLRRIAEPSARGLTTVALVLSMTALATPLVLRVKRYVEAPRGLLLAELDLDARALVAALQTETPPDAVVLVQPEGAGTWSDAAIPRAALERLSNRATLVNYKFVPTLPSELTRWYRLWKLRKAVFEGDCTALARLPDSRPVTHLVLEGPSAVGAVHACGRVIWQGGRFTLLNVARSWRPVSSHDLGRRATGVHAPEQPHQPGPP